MGEDDGWMNDLDQGEANLFYESLETLPSPGVPSGSEIDETLVNETSFVANVNEEADNDETPADEFDDNTVEETSNIEIPADEFDDNVDEAVDGVEDVDSRFKSRRLKSSFQSLSKKWRLFGDRLAQ